jgi:3-oxoadipate enol-lactonase/4-carboxymuconolactone decarboxylase
LANTSARADAEGTEKRRQAVLSGGMNAVADLVMGRFFSPSVLASRSPAVASSRRTLLTTEPAGYAGCCAAIRDMNQIGILEKIQVPTLIVCGDLDVSLPYSGHGDVLERGIRGARIVHLPTAHLGNIEMPRTFTAALLGFLLEPHTDVYEAGMRVRREVLGDSHVDKALVSASRSDDFQNLITRYAWGTIWTRPGLDVRTRRLLVLAMTAAMGRWEEFRLHVRTGLPRELEWCDIEEVLLQAAIYAGVPAANTGLHAAYEERKAVE